MLKEHPFILKQAIALIDFLLIASGFALSYYLVGAIQPLGPLADYWYYPVGFLAFYLYFAWTRSLFSILQFGWFKGLIRRVFAIFISAEVLGAAILYFTPQAHGSRELYLVFGATSFLLVMGEKLALRWIFLTIRRNNRNTTPVLVFGRGRQAVHVMHQIVSHPELGLRVIRKIDPSVSPQEFGEILSNLYVDEVFFFIPRSATREGFLIDPFLQVCEEMGRPARVFVNLSQATHFARWKQHTFMDEPTMLSYTAELDPDQLLLKRLFDLCGALVGMTVLIALYPFIAFAIKATSRGPVFFKQVRVGKNGKRFIIYKFRTMYIGAEAKKKELQAHNELSGAVFKMKDDPRVTPLGKIFRALSLDELPQFLNVLRGEMSLVGTRPPTPEEVRQYSQWHYRRISIKPGITGLWQVSGRNKITQFDEIVKLDLKYIDSWSIWFDIAIIFKTLAIVLLRHDDAY